MHFNNTYKIPLFDSFFDNYSEIINNMVDESQSSEIVIVSSNHKNAGFIIGPNDYFTTNPIFKTKNIAYNEDNCDKIELTIQEKYAFIAHELGHIYDTRNYNENESLAKEINADEMACKIGLQEYLISGLQKIIDNDTNVKTVDDIIERILYRKSKGNPISYTKLDNTNYNSKP